MTIDWTKIDLRPSGDIMSQDDLARLLEAYGCLPEYKTHQFRIGDKPQQFCGLFVYLNHAEKKSLLGLWGGLCQLKESELIKLIQQVLVEP